MADDMSSSDGTEWPFPDICPWNGDGPTGSNGGLLPDTARLSFDETGVARCNARLRTTLVSPRNRTIMRY
jgi:hypothetical protein